jgi:Rrf2 family protein
MLKLTKKADYGLMALKFLAEHPETPALSAKDVADAYGIPAQLLAKILQRLTKVGLLRSHAGMNGGYALARDARQISAFEVIHAIDGPLFITSCFKGAKSCDLTPSCTIKEPLARVNETITGVLKSISRCWRAGSSAPKPIPPMMHWEMVTGMITVATQVKAPAGLQLPIYTGNQAMAPWSPAEKGTRGQGTS